MSAFVLDASIAAKWFLPPDGEPFANQAMHLLKRYTAGTVHFIVPDLFWSEFGNILWKAVRYGRYSQRDAEQAISEMRRIGLPTAASIDLLNEAFAIATAFERSVYDSIYVALAVSSKAALITADERLANALAARFPIRWLGAI